MSPFNLEDYEPVEDRLRAFWKDHPMGRVTTELVTSPSSKFYIVKASIWRGFEVKSERLGEVPPPGGTGYALEIVTQRGVNATSALENCETSAIGRALANLGYAAKGKRPSREEMTKASAVEPGSPVTQGAGKAAEDGEGVAGLGEVPAAPTPLTDAQRWMEEFHPGKPHRMKRSDRVADLEYCTQVTIGSASCPFAREIARTT